MTVRDRVVLWVLVLGVLSSLLTWHFIGHWLALGVGLLAVGVACVVYRIEAPRIDVDHPERWSGRRADEAQRVDQ